MTEVFMLVGNVMVSEIIEESEICYL